ncbi:MAG TPA: Calx-beta domain-containing protein, partial [Anaerolineales bacterium]|nr:Calx-beta domain-containing protein [Anaerolineales bacterium]
PGTATAGDDYTATSGNLIFNPGETSLTFEVRIKTDDILDPNETVLLELSNPDDATLGTPSTATLTIKESGFGIYLPIILK